MTDKFKDAITAVVVAYIIYILVDSFCTDTPGFCVKGWLIWGAYVAGLIAWFKYRFFN